MVGESEVDFLLVHFKYRNVRQDFVVQFPQTHLHIAHLNDLSELESAVK